jgi:thiamine pyrophosphate-dependent acetolactate synthase large subunit-like protein
VRVAEAVGQVLAELGAERCFGVVGSGNFEVTNALVAAGGVFLATRHESGAVTAADAYARLSGRVGLATVHQGPGLTNAVTGLAEAAKSRTPLLVLAGDTAAGAIHSNFRMDQGGLAESVGALSEALGSAETAVEDVVRAWRRAVLERRPVVVSMPIDVQAAECPAPDSFSAPAPPAPVAAGAEEVAAAARLLAHARRPLLIGGRGAVLAGARKPIEQLARATGALLATSAVANGLFAGNPYYLGISGGFATPLAAELIRKADVVVSFGAGLNMWTTRQGRLLDPAARLVQVDVEADAIGAHRRADVALVGDAAETARALLEVIGQGSPVTWRTPELAGEIARRRWRDEPYKDASGDGRIDPRTLVIALDDLLPGDRLLACDGGHFMGWLPMYCSVPDAQGMVFTQGFQAIGGGFATAVGAAVARPDRLVVCGLGDGGALMGISELETIVRLGLPVLAVVFNDAAYGAEVHHFGPDGGSLDSVRFPDTDFASLGRAAGAEALTVRSRADLEPVREWLERRERPLLVDAKIVPTVVAEWLPEALGH